MNKKVLKFKITLMLLSITILCFSSTVCAQEPDDTIDEELQSFVEYDGYVENIEEFDQYVDGIYNVGENARASMTGLIRLYQSNSKLAVVYSTSYSNEVARIGVKNIKLQYKGTLGIWHTIITLDDRYRTNASAYQGSFSCSGVVGRVYRVTGTHYIINGSYTESRNNVTGELTFR